MINLLFISWFKTFTNPFEFRISRCDVAIEDVGDRNWFVNFIGIDSAQGFHQLKV